MRHRLRWLVLAVVLLVVAGIVVAIVQVQPKLSEARDRADFGVDAAATGARRPLPGAGWGGAHARRRGQPDPVRCRRPARDADQLGPERPRERSGDAGADRQRPGGAGAAREGERGRVPASASRRAAERGAGHVRQGAGEPTADRGLQPGGARVPEGTQRSDPPSRRDRLRVRRPPGSSRSRACSSAGRAEDALVGPFDAGHLPDRRHAPASGQDRVPVLEQRGGASGAGEGVVQLDEVPEAGRLLLVEE